MTNFLSNLCIIIISIIVHETGHFLAAKLLNYGIKEYSIGFGPKIFQKEKKGILYTIRLIQLGGYVSLQDSCEGKRDITKPDATNIIIHSMGIIFNFILAILALTLRYLLKGINLGGALNGSIFAFIQTLKPVLFNFEYFINNGFIVNIPENLLWAFNDIDQILISVFWINLNIGFLNSLPIPIFDGGRVISDAIELMLEEKTAKKVINAIYVLFIIVVGIFMFVK